MFLALFTLSLSFALFFSAVYSRATRFGLLSQAVESMVLTMLTLPFYAAAVYRLIKKYGKDSKH